MSDLDLDLAIATAKAKKAKATYGTASQDESARKKLEELEANGTIRPAEKATLDALRGNQGANTDTIGRTGAAYRGFSAGATLNARDNIADMFGFDGEGIRTRDAAANAAYPDDFGKGNIAGGGASMVLPGVGIGKLAQGLSTLGKIFAYGTVGGLNGGISGFMDETGGGAGFTGPDLANRVQNAKTPAAWGAGLGIAAPLLASGGGALARLFANRAQDVGDVGSRAISRLRPALADTVAPQGDVEAYLRSLGPEAMLADVPGPMQNQAMGLASMQGRGGAELSRAVNNRAVGAGPRITQTMDAGITGPNAAFDLRRTNAAERTNKLGPEYEAALSAPGQLDITPVLSAMDPNAVGAQRAELDMLRRNLGLDVQPGAQPLNTFINAPKLHNVRSELSDNISAATREGRGGFVAATKPALTAIDDVLNTIPGYQDARTGYANNKAMDRAIEEGQTALRGGRVSALAPEELRVEFDKLSTAQKDAFRTGLRRDIAGLMGTAKNDAAAAWGEFAKTWNEEKLNIVLGADAEPILNRLKAEKVFSETRGRIDAGSMTAKRNEATKGLAAADVNQKPSIRSDIFSAPINAVYGNLVDPITFGPRRSRLNADMGKALAKSGPEAEALLRAMLEQTARGQRREPAIQAFETLFRNSLLAAGGGVAASK
jgi:hypothetical protein